MKLAQRQRIRRRRRRLTLLLIALSALAAAVYWGLRTPGGDAAFGLGPAPTAGPADPAVGPTPTPSPSAQPPPTPATRPAPPPDLTFDLIIAGGTVVDGSGQAGFRADVGTHQGKIVYVGNLSGARAGRRIDAGGLVVAPGFINPHSHTWDPIQPTDPDARASLMQGITTEFGGVDGRSLWPIGPKLDEIAAAGTGVNYGTFVGQGTVRAQVIGYADRAATAAELDHMQELVRQGMAAGAFGLSTGLEYVPGRYGNTAEVMALARAAAAAGGVYSTHLRSEGDRILEALDEALAIGAGADIPVNLSHFKVVYPQNWPKFDQVLSRIRAAREQGQTVFADVYPYLAPDYATYLSLGDVYRRYDPATLVIRWSQDPALRDKTLAQVAAERGVAPAIAAQGLLAAEQTIVVAEIISAEQMATLLRQEWAVVGTDGEAQPFHPDALEAAKVHPRSYGTYPRVLGRYVREQGLMPLPTAVRKMSGAVADHLGLRDRGYIRPGYWADIVVFDPATVTDQATWAHPQRYPEGIRHVLVNGRAAVADGRFIAGVRAGQVLRHRSR